MIDAETIEMARQYVGDNLTAPEKDFGNELRDAGIDPQELLATVEIAIAQSHMMDPVYRDKAIFIGAFLVGFICGRWEEHAELTGMGGSDD